MIQIEKRFKPKFDYMGATKFIDFDFISISAFAFLVKNEFLGVD